ncbi:phage portal protein [Micromonospora sp. WMMD718]|uniref:phage portal protein n=2 Tax=Micromonospora sp. WMMD718 TaxID=3016098 RepID=UPI0024172F38|nr:phage portal protein [Micromonospora sp. WMMD718]MDG4756061.1 phage portal protein [Micromonospora sp. WMMD718]
MGFFRSVLSQRASSTGASGVATPEKWVEEWFTGGSSTASGPWVSEDTALHYSPFFAGVNAIATDVGKLPLPLYERLERGKRRAREHRVYRVLHDQPNEIMPPVVFKRTLQGHALTWGTGYAHVLRNGRGEVTEVWPIRPDRITPEVTRTGPGKLKVTYRYVDDVNGIYTRLFPDEVLPIGGLGYDGIRGYSVVKLARQSIGMGLATEQFGNSFFSNGARPGGVLKTSKKMSPEGHKRLQADWENLHRGLDRAQRVAILEEGLEWQDIGIPPEDAQFLETRKLQVNEMCRWLRLPPHKIGDLERATFSNIEWQSLEYLQDTLLGWLVTWEQYTNMRLLTERERPRFFAEHIVDAITRGDLKSRYEAYAIGRNWGWLSGDDIRERENENPLPDGRGETYLVPLNMQPAPAPNDPPQPGRACPVHPGCTCNATEHTT